MKSSTQEMLSVKLKDNLMVMRRNFRKSLQTLNAHLQATN